MKINNTIVLIILLSLMLCACGKPKTESAATGKTNIELPAVSDQASPEVSSELSENITNSDPTETGEIDQDLVIPSETEEIVVEVDEGQAVGGF